MTTDEYVPDEEQVRGWCHEGTGDYPDVMDEWLDRFLARVKRDAAREALAQADHRIARLEAQTDIRGRAVVMYRERAREAEAERDYWKREHAELRDELVATQEHGATMAHGRDDALHETAEAEARIEAVRDIHRDLYESMSGVPYCDECDRAWPCDTIRALDGTDTPPDAG